MLPEVAIISTKWTKRDRLPKKTTLKQFQSQRAYILITGDGINQNESDKSYMDYTDAGTNADDGFTVSGDAVFNNQGNITVLVSKDGSYYTVIGGSFAKTFSSIDDNNKRFSN